MLHNVLCDIVEYKEVDNILVPDVPEGYDPLDYESYQKSDIYPLERVNLLGYGSWIPKNSYTVLKWYLTYADLSWYDPIPFILTKLYNPEFTEL